jgi:hypothetical protein
MPSPGVAGKPAVARTWFRCMRFCFVCARVPSLWLCQGNSERMSVASERLSAASLWAPLQRRT